MEWSLPRKVAFRLLFVYLALYCFPAPHSAPLFSKLIPWAATRVGYPLSFHFTGSGDTTFHYVQAGIFIVVAIVTAAIWSVLDRKRPNYCHLYLWLLLLVRVSLGMTMITYGSMKAIPSQFPYVQPDRLLQPLGDSSPMGLLWNFMSASPAYTVFTGISELVGGLLLFFRRTTTLGALICIGVLTNVVVLNFAYDVPVKLFSSHLLLMAILLAASDAKRLANLFLFNRTSEAVTIEPLITRLQWQRVAVAAKVVLLVGFVGTSLHSSYSTRKSLQEMTRPSALHGIWQVDEFVQVGDDRPVSVTEERRWWRLAVVSDEYAFVQLTNTTRDAGPFYVRPKDKRLYFRDQPFEYTQPTPETLELEGYYRGHDIRARLHKFDPSHFPLFNRGFHWINEYPINK